LTAHIGPGEDLEAAQRAGEMRTSTFSAWQRSPRTSRPISPAPPCPRSRCWGRSMPLPRSRPLSPTERGDAMPNQNIVREATRLTRAGQFRGHRSSAAHAQGREYRRTFWQHDRCRPNSAAAADHRLEAQCRRGGGEPANHAGRCCAAARTPGAARWDPRAGHSRDPAPKHTEGRPVRSRSKSGTLLLWTAMVFLTCQRAEQVISRGWAFRWVVPDLLHVSRQRRDVI
jgi:hypothetical protein